MKSKDFYLTITIVCILAVMLFFLRYLQSLPNLTSLNTYKASANLADDKDIQLLMIKLKQETGLNLTSSGSDTFSYSTVDTDTEIENLNQSGKLRTFLMNNGFTQDSYDVENSRESFSKTNIICIIERNKLTSTISCEALK